MANAQALTIAQFLATTRILEISPETPADERMAILKALAVRLRDAEVDELFRETVRGQVLSVLRHAGEARPARLLEAVEAQAKRTPSPSSRSIVPADPEPWPEPVSGAPLIQDITALIVRHLVIPRGAAIALAAWIMATWCVEELFTAPILALLSPTKQSGKTLTLSILRRLVKRPLPITSVTTAMTFRIMHEFRPTLLWDEAECLGEQGNRDQIAIVNSGYQKGTPVFRCGGDNYTPQDFDPFGFRAVGAIGSLADTLVDRSIIIPMVRAPGRRNGDSLVMVDQNGDPKEPFNEYTADQDTADLRRMLTRWSADNASDVGQAATAQKTHHSWLGYRGSQNWAPLFEIGRRCGEMAEQQLMEASKTLTSMCLLAGDDPGELLIHDIAEVFAATRTPDLSSAELAQLLAARKDSPWAEHSRGRALTPHRLSLLLRPFGIAPQQFRSRKHGKVRGYARAQFSEVFRSFGFEIDGAA